MFRALCSWILFSLLLMGGSAAAALPQPHATPATVQTVQATQPQVPASIDRATDFHYFIGYDSQPITWWQMSLRGIMIFLFALVLVRLSRRVFERFAPVDIILSVLIGSNLSRALTANAPFFPTLIATAALVTFYWAIIFAAVKSRTVSLLIKGRSQQFIRQGKLDRKSMTRYGIADDDLREALRSAGMHELDEVESAYLERNGAINLLRKRTDD